MLDEPNSNLDQAGLDALINVFSTLKSKGTTVIVIAHQPNVIRHVDALLVLASGQIQLTGPRDKVLAKPTFPVAAPASKPLDAIQDATG